MTRENYQDLEDFKLLLQRISENFNLVQGFGGNASVKTSSRMLVKASGKRMGSVTDPTYFHEVSLEEREPVDNIPGQSTRPSIEVFLHALMEETFVLHLHSTLGVAISMLASSDSEIAVELEKLAVTNLSYLRPGKELSRGIEKALALGKSSAFLLGNHGTLFSSNSVSDLEDKVMGFESWAEGFLTTRRGSSIASEKLTSAEKHSRGDHAVWHALHNWRISPDHCVFLGLEPDLTTLSILSSASTSNEIFDAPVTLGGQPTVRSEQLAWFFDVTQVLPRRLLTTLEQSEAQYLAGWEAEKHRVSGA